MVCRLMVLQSVSRPDKDEVEASNGIVAAMHPLAAEAGLEMLRRGGNAIDAAVATGFAISVVEPNNSSVSGVGFMLIHLNSAIRDYAAGSDLVIEYGPRAPLAARRDMYKVTGAGSGISTYKTENDENAHGYRSIAVPGTVAGLCKAHELLGVLPLEQVMEPAIQYAQEGFEVYWALTLVIAANMKQLQRFPSSRDLFLPEGVPPGYLSDPSSADEGAYRLVQRDLADLLKRIAKNGRSAMYEGEVAQAIEEDMKANGGILTKDDLSKRTADVKSPLRITYRDYEILCANAPNGAWTVLQTMNILENFPLASLEHNSHEHIHLFIEAARHAFADRYHYMADPSFVDVPLKGLLSKDYAAEIASQIDMDSASLESSSDLPPWNYYSSTALHDPWLFEGRPKPSVLTDPSVSSSDDCTTHFGTVDKNGNLVSCTQTAVSSFGSKVITKGLGILWNNGMIWFNAKPGYANSIEPWKRPLVNAAPLLVTKKGKPYVSIGSPGGRKVNNANTNVALNMLDFDMGPQEAITVPRVDVSGPTTQLDTRFSQLTIAKLRQLGHNVEVISDIEAWYSFARPSAVMVDNNRGTFRSGSDPASVPTSKGY